MLKRNILYTILLMLGLMFINTDTIYADDNYASVDVNSTYNFSTIVNNSAADETICKINVPKNGRIRVEFSEIDSFVNNGGISVYISKGDNDFVWYGRLMTQNIEGGITGWATVRSGDYYIKMSSVVHSNRPLHVSNPNTAKFKVAYQTESEYCGESTQHDTYDTADELQYGINYECDGYNNGLEKNDIFKFVLTSAGKVDVEINAADGWSYDYEEEVYDSIRSNHIVKLYAEGADRNITELYELNKNISSVRLPAGIYYIEIDAWNYSICVKAQSEDANSHEIEFNNTSSKANEITFNNPYIGNFNDDEDKDYYKFVINKKSLISPVLVIPRQSSSKVEIALYDSNLKDPIVQGKTDSNPTYYLEKQGLEPGTYYICVKGSKELGADYTLAVYQSEYIVLNQTKKDCYMGKSFKLKLVGATDVVKWSSSNKKIATVNSSGKVKIKGVGSAKIIASYKGKNYVCKVKGKSYFYKTSYSDLFTDYKIKSVKGKKVTIQIKVLDEKYTKKFTLDSKGKKATATFKCKYGKKHKMIITVKPKTDSINVQDKSSCGSKLM